ncbi:MAG TPA: hypothetical protein VJ842_04675 [Pyrinomonadaceae bacterium]|nr:hypothetical protein [Pyrinomonadaceae bacterium]
MPSIFLYNHAILKESPAILNQLLAILKELPVVRNELLAILSYKRTIFLDKIACF